MYIAIVKAYDIDLEYGEKVLPYFVSEWQEVSEEDFKKIKEGIHRVPADWGEKYIIVEKPHQDDLISKALKAQDAHIKQMEEIKAKHEREQEAKRAKLKKTKEQLFEELKKELGK